MKVRRYNYAAQFGGDVEGLLARYRRLLLGGGTS